MQLGEPLRRGIQTLEVFRFLGDRLYKNSSGDEIANVNFYAVRPEATREPPIFGPRLLWPNGCMDQDVTWYGGQPRPT